MQYLGFKELTHTLFPGSVPFPVPPGTTPTQALLTALTSREWVRLLQAAFRSGTHIARPLQLLRSMIGLIDAQSEAQRKDTDLWRINRWEQLNAELDTTYGAAHEMPIGIKTRTIKTRRRAVWRMQALYTAEYSVRDTEFVQSENERRQLVTKLVECAAKGLSESVRSERDQALVQV